jgi:hypothetical protein
MWDPKRIADPAWFLDRAKERRALRDFIERRDNVLVYGLRRLGKTSLIRRVQEDLPRTAFLLIDCNFADTEEELSRFILDQLRQSRIARARQFLDVARRAAHDLEIGVEVRGAAVYATLRRGAPGTRPLEDTLEFTTRVAAASKTHVVIVLDEFQNIMADSRTSVAKLRDHAQRQDKVSYVVAGSQPTVLLNLVRHKSPFWRQLTEFRVGPIDVPAALKDVARLTKARVPPAAQQTIAAITRGNTQRLAEILEACWSRRKRFQAEDVEEAALIVAGRHEASFERILSQLTRTQRRVLLALARDEPEHPTGSAFINRNDLGAPTTVQRAMGALRASEVLDDEGAFVDPLFSWWIRRQGPGLRT